MSWKPAHRACCNSTTDVGHAFDCPRMLAQAGVELPELQAEIDELTKRRDALRLDVDRLAAIAGKARLGGQVTPVGGDRRRWLRERLAAAGHEVRDAGWRILNHIDASPDFGEEHEGLIDALHTLLDAQERWKNAWSATAVDANHRVRDAMKRSEDCEVHGAEIRELAETAGHFDEAYQRADQGRGALLSGIWRLEGAVDALDVRRQLGRDTPDDEKLIPVIRRHLAELHRMHEKAWKSKAKPKAGR